MELVIWRHPRPRDVAGRCIGRTDVRVDRRKAKRLAHAIRREARERGWPREVWTSTLQRSALVGELLAGWGWRHRCDPRLDELDFGAWDGRSWDEVAQHEVQAWCDDFAMHRPGAGESLVALFERCEAFLRERATIALMVGHAGWMQAAVRIAQGEGVPAHPQQWRIAPRYGARLHLTWEAASSA